MGAAFRNMGSEPGKCNSSFRNVVVRMLVEGDAFLGRIRVLIKTAMAPWWMAKKRGLLAG